MCRVTWFIREVCDVERVVELNAVVTTQRHQVDRCNRYAQSDGGGSSTPRLAVHSQTVC